MQPDKALVLFADFPEAGLRLQHPQTQAIAIQMRKDLTPVNLIAFFGEYLYNLAGDARQNRCLRIGSDGCGRMIGGEDVSYGG